MQILQLSLWMFQTNQKKCCLLIKFYVHNYRFAFFVTLFSLTIITHFQFQKLFFTKCYVVIFYSPSLNQKWLFGLYRYCQLLIAYTLLYQVFFSVVCCCLVLYLFHAIKWSTVCKYQLPFIFKISIKILLLFVFCRNGIDEKKSCYCLAKIQYWAE